jgi:hypothetical protein
MMHRHSSIKIPFAEFAHLILMSGPLRDAEKWTGQVSPISDCKGGLRP